MKEPDGAKPEDVALKLEGFVKGTQDLYTALNSYKTWFNESIANYELILEDDWLENGTTTIAYGLRCLDTLDMLFFAEDVYRSHQDAKGVWHLDDYVQTEWLTDTPYLAIEQFIAQNGPVRNKADA